MTDYFEQIATNAIDSPSLKGTFIFWIIFEFFILFPGEKWNKLNTIVPGLNANGLQIYLRVQRGMTFFIWIFICIMASKKLFI